MVLGTSSGAGKSLMTAALCRALKRRGEQPLPFKGQNMSNNAWVDGQGGEMAYSQALQAWAAGLEPCCAMNPVLLKPQGDSTSEVIHNGHSVGKARADTYYQEWFKPGWRAIRSGLDELSSAHPQGRLVLEGAGSPVEVNLQHRDLTNLRLAQFLRARCLLVADIERGGVFAQIIGTLALLRPVERPLIQGLLVNRFRGRRSLFDEGVKWLEEHTGVPVMGVMPWLDEVFPPEDSLDLLERRPRKPEAELEIAVVRLPSLSNFSDLDPLEAEASVKLHWIRPGEPLGNPDAVVLPGSKQTLRDLKSLERCGLAQELQRYGATGGVVFGICGGMQMLGHTLTDPNNLEGGEADGPWTGLGLLNIATRFGGEKTLQQRRVDACWPRASTITGFELHHGTSVAGSDLQPISADAELGWWKATASGGYITGTYLHGLLENGPWRRHWINLLRRPKNLPPLDTDRPHHGEHREQLLNRLADAFEQHVDIRPLLH